MQNTVTCQFPNGPDELFVSLEALPAGTFEESAAELLSRYQQAAGAAVPVVLRFHLSDITNQAEILRGLMEKKGLRQSVSMVGQAPLSGAKIALEGWLLSRPSPAYRFQLYRNDFSGQSGSEAQMQREFEELSERLAGQGSIPENIIRTWIYCRDIDNNYHGLVKARREFFAQIGLTEKTHYLASTGIEGKSEEPSRLVCMDALGIFGMQDEQLEYMHAPEHLSPTHIYGVTFERGTRFLAGDRSHYFLSGTASIDKDGRILHPLDIQGQTRRMIENVEALLMHHGGTLSDLKLAVVYLRDPADRQTVQRILEERLSAHCAYLMVQASICRPGWLLEMDGIAVNDTGNEVFAKFA